MKKLNIIIIKCILIVGILVSCEKKTSKNYISGTWTQLGYGRIIKIEDSTYTYYNSSKHLCEPLVEGNLNDRFTIISYNNDTLVLNPGGIVDYYFTRSNKLPELCKNEKDEIDNEPLTNFNSFWNTFNENYAFFEQRNIDWKSVYNKYYPKIKNASSSRELFQYLKEIADSFDDGHIRLDVPDSLRQVSPTRISKSKVISKEKIQNDILVNYVKNYKEYNNGVVKWGKLKNGKLGYIQISDMNGFANYVSNQKVSSEKFVKQYNDSTSKKSALELFKDEVDGVDYILKKILKDYKDTESVIIDLRFNGGGYETVALKLLSYFVKEKKHILSINAKTASGRTPRQSYYLNPSENSYPGEVFLLTSDATASAAEIFALGARSYPEKITSIGATTNGIFSEILWKKLPNGWEYSMSNEIYMDPKGNVLESKGVPVDIEMDYPKARNKFYSAFYSEGTFKDETIEQILDRQNN